MKMTDSASMYLFAVSGEIIKDSGEDSVYCHNGAEGCVIGVFDGCGGLGSRRYRSENNHTGAYIASRLASKVVSEYTERKPADTTLNDVLIKAFSEKKLKLEEKDGTARIRSDMQKTLPTTLCMAAVNKSGDAEVQWLGDSLAYTLDSKGLHCLNGDSYVSESSDSIRDKRLEGYVNSDEQFMLRSRKLKISCPKILFTATDGFYGAFHTAMELEYMLLDTMSKASDYDSWKKLINESVDEIASDDYTAAVCIYGYKDFSDLRGKFRNRLEFLAKKIQPLLTAENYKEYESRIPEIWKEYRHDYLEKV